MSIVKLAHLSDLHIRKSPLRNNEYESTFQKLYKSLEENKPQRIIISGDLVHDFLDLQGEQLIMCSNFLNRLAQIAKVVIVRGNHDIRKSHLSRVDSIEAIVRSINNPNIQYLNETDFFNDENITWAVWKHGEKNNSPWTRHKKYIKKEGQTYIDLFHDPINGCSSNAGFEFDSKTYYKLSDFKSDYCMFGDIHKKQYFFDKDNKNNIKAAYAGSLISQDFSEGDDNFHGYLLWNIENGSVIEVPIENEYSFKNIIINPYTNFQDLDIDIENPSKYMRIRFIWRTLPATKTKENERLLVEYLKNKYGESIISIKQKVEFLEEDKIDIIESKELENITDKVVQHNIFKDYLIKIGVSESDINEILLLDDEITSRLTDIEEITNIQWDIVKFSGKNFMSYKDIEVNWDDLDGIFQVTGSNTAGKTTFFKLLTYVLFSKCIETENKMKNGDVRFINNKLDVNFCEADVIIRANNKYYGIKRKTIVSKNKSGEITGSPTSLNYYVLSSPNEELDDTNIIDKLNDEDKNKTQKQIEKIIGTYENFIRTSLTTADNLNAVIQNDPAQFIDSLLLDASLDVFEKKLDVFKEYQKAINNMSRITCNVEITKQQIKSNEDSNVLINNEITDINNIKLPEHKNRIIKGNEYVEDQTKKLNNIDPEIYTLNINDVNSKIKEHNDNIDEFNKNNIILKQSIISLCETYDEVKLSEIIKKKDEHKQTESTLKLSIKDFERKISDENHKIEIINGEIFNLKKEGTKLKEQITEKNQEIVKFKESKICPSCGQALLPEHQKHIDENIEEINAKIKGITNEMLSKAAEIRKRENESIPAIKIIITEFQNNINNINIKIKELSVEMESTLKLIGELTNDKNDSIKRKEIVATIEKIPFQIENEQLKIDILNGKLDQYNKSLVKIEENKAIEIKIKAGKELLTKLNLELEILNNDLNTKKNNIELNKNKIIELNNLINEFEKQEKRDSIFDKYKKLLNRNGVPRQLLINNIIPKINNELAQLLIDIDFKIYLDPNDIKLKLVYHNNLDAVIDAISASGKERTFAAISLKYALNQINAKSKPSICIYDEITGKLNGISIQEFCDIIQSIKKKMKKIVIIEHNIEINPDFIIDVTKDENGISSLIIE